MSNKIAVINGVRGYAILCVVWLHLWGWEFDRFDYAPLISVFGHTILHANSVKHLNMAVNMFFILSGLVLTLPYAQGKRFMRTRSDILWFFRHRAARLLPLYYVCLFVMMFMYSDLPV